LEVFCTFANECGKSLSGGACMTLLCPKSKLKMHLFALAEHANSKFAKSIINYIV